MCYKQLIWNCMRCKKFHTYRCPYYKRGNLRFRRQMRMNEKDKIEKALEIAFLYGQIDGAHHKTWVINEMVMALSDNYAKFISDYETDEDGNEYSWDCGIAP